MSMTLDVLEMGCSSPCGCALRKDCSGVSHMRLKRTVDRSGSHAIFAGTLLATRKEPGTPSRTVPFSADSMTLVVALVLDVRISFTEYFFIGKEPDFGIGVCVACCVFFFVLFFFSIFC